MILKTLIKKGLINTAQFLYNMNTIMKFLIFLHKTENFMLVYFDGSFHSFYYS